MTDQPRTETGTIEHPRPEGMVRFSYDPTSPMQWNLVPLHTHVYVYRDVRAALVAQSYWVDQIWAKMAAEGRNWPQNVPFRILYRGESDIAARLMPSLLRGPLPLPQKPTRSRHKIDATPEEAAATHDRHGHWYEEDGEFRSADALMSRLSAEWIMECGAREHAALIRAQTIPLIATLGPFQQRAAVRHYAGIPSTILDVSTSSQVAALFATGSADATDPRIRSGQIGVLWAIDFSLFDTLFELRFESVPGGRRVVLTQPKGSWGDNERMFQDQGIPTVSLTFTDVDLPLPRPTAQKGMFLSLSQEDGSDLPIKSQLHWWGMIERWSYPTGFIHSGRIFENAAEGVTQHDLFPVTDPYLSIGEH